MQFSAISLIQCQCAVHHVCIHRFLLSTSTFWIWQFWEEFKNLHSDKFPKGCRRLLLLLLLSGLGTRCLKSHFLHINSIFPMKVSQLEDRSLPLSNSSAFFFNHILNTYVTASQWVRGHIVDHYACYMWKLDPDVHFRLHPGLTTWQMPITLWWIYI